MFLLMAMFLRLSDKKLKIKTKIKSVRLQSGVRKIAYLPSCCVYLIKKGGLKKFLFQIKKFWALPS